MVFHMKTTLNIDDTVMSRRYLRMWRKNFLYPVPYQAPITIDI